MKLLTIIALTLLSSSIFSKEIAISFDDSPTGSSIFQNGVTRTQKLIEGLDLSNTKAIFFCNTRKIEQNETQKNRLLDFAKAGHLLANHTHSHPNLHKVGVDAFIDEVKKAHTLLKDLPNFTNYFRFPFLNNGGTLDERNQALDGIIKLGYKHGYVTVDNYDWYLDYLFRKAVKDKKKIDYKKLKKFYVDYLLESVNFYDHMAKSVLGRSPKHVLLLHENDLASLFINDLIEHFKLNGWTIISPERAYSDPIANQDPNIALGQGRITRIAKSKSYSGPLAHRLEHKENWKGLLESLSIISDK